jgi:hypothetical protein
MENEMAKEFVPDDTKSKKTEKGPHGGGTKYHQMAMPKPDFMTLNNSPRLKGHSQKKNVE